MFSYSALFTITLSALTAAAPHFSCSSVVVFFARGTTEPGTKGTIVGPPFEDELRQELGGTGKTLTFEGVDYPANVRGFLAGGDAGGARTMANSVTTTAQNCPNAKIVMSGYSQGAQVVHLAAASLSPALQNRVNAVVTFGDPNRDETLPGVLEGRRKTFCAAGDLICDGKAQIRAPHLSYGGDAPEAASFVAARV
ncbi:cutinase [Crassisporium funariophilum]|nr:cutinase [Crassisporium funariophilum]